MSTQVDLFTNVEQTSVSPAIAKPFVSRSTFYQGDCLVEMDKIADKSVDMILCDLPYGTTACKWDSVIPFEPMWEQYNRIAKDNAAIVLTASQPFTSALVMSNTKLFKYELIWEKPNPSNFTFAKHGVMKYHESILIFYKSNPTYNPQKVKGSPNHNTTVSVRKRGNETGANTKIIPINISDEKHPKSVIKFNREMGLHPTQKPVPLFEWLISTYTNEGDTVLDNCMGSGTTGVACKKTGRHFIGIEKDEKYFEIAVSRVSAYCG